MISVLNSISICKFYSSFRPETDNAFTLLFVKWVFSGYKSLSLVYSTITEEGWTCQMGTISENFLKINELLWFCTTYNPWYQGYNRTYIVYRKYFWVDRKSFFIGSIGLTRAWLVLWIPLPSFVLPTCQYTEI